MNQLQSVNSTRPSHSGTLRWNTGNTTVTWPWWWWRTPTIFQRNGRCETPHHKPTNPRKVENSHGFHVCCPHPCVCDVTETGLFLKWVFGVCKSTMLLKRVFLGRCIPMWLQRRHTNVAEAIHGIAAAFSERSVASAFSHGFRTF